MKPLLALLLALPVLASTHIVDTLYQSDGLTTAFGRIEVQGQRRDANGHTTLTSRVTIAIATGGLVDFRLEGGASASYRATVYLTNSTGSVMSSYDEPSWVVPVTGSTLTLRDIRTEPAAISTYLPNGFYCLSVASRHWTIITCADGSGPSWSATHATGGTRITDIVYAADGVTPATGRVALQGFQRDANGKTALTGPLSIPIGANGAISFLLEGGSGVRFQPTVYASTANGRTSSYQEPPWVVPNTVTVLNIRNVRGSAVPNTLSVANGLRCISVGSNRWSYATCPTGPAITWSTITSGIWAGITISTWSTVIQ